MKRSQNTIGFSKLGLALLVGLFTACQHEDIQTLTPDAETTSIHSNAKTVFIPQLLKDGKKELKYFDQYHVNRGKLWRVTDSSKGEYVEYQYNSNTITAQKRKIGSNALIYQVTYQLDASGKCVETYQSTSQKTFSYTYNQLGQLSKAYDKALPNNRMEFSYNAAHDLSMITCYDQTNVKVKEVSYYYLVSGGSPMQNNYHINPSYIVEDAEYLPIFGKFHSFLVTTKVETNLAANGNMISGWTKNYTYTFNASQLPSTISETPFGSNTPEVRTLTYSVPKL